MPSGCEGVEIHIASLADIVDLRHRVLRQGMPRETAVFQGDTSPGVVHFAAYEGSRVVACATLHPDVLDHKAAYQLRGMATEAEFRRRGFGRLLLLACEKEAVSNGIALLWCNARKTAVDFYKKMNWQVVSGEFEMPPGGTHFRMVRHVNP